MLKKSTHKWPKRGSDEAKKALTRGQKGNSHLAKKALTCGQRFKSQIFVGPDSGKTSGIAVVLDFTRSTLSIVPTEPIYLNTTQGFALGA